MQVPNDIDKASEYLKQAIPEGIKAQASASLVHPRTPKETSPSTTGRSSKD